jgi:hypothetical protein
MMLLTPMLLAVTSGVLAPAGDSLLVEVAGRVTVLHAAELAQLPRDSVRWDYHGTPHTYSGIWLTVLLRRTGVPIDTLRGPNLTRRLVVEASDGYRAVFTLAELAPGLGSRDVLLADREDGHPVSDAVGPLRLVAPGDGAGARSVRQVIALRVRDEP